MDSDYEFKRNQRALEEHLLNEGERRTELTDTLESVKVRQVWKMHLAFLLVYVSSVSDVSQEDILENF